jgi:L-ribulose-5-phosphate 4-epimerase
MALDELRERVFEANRKIVEAGLVVLTFGNASAVDRTAGVLAIKPSGVPYAELAGIELLVIDAETRRAEFAKEVRWNQAYFQTVRGG